MRKGLGKDDVAESDEEDSEDREDDNEEEEDSEESEEDIDAALASEVLMFVQEDEGGGCWCVLQHTTMQND